MENSFASGSGSWYNSGGNSMGGSRSRQEPTPYPSMRDRYNQGRNFGGNMRSQGYQPYSQGYPRGGGMSYNMDLAGSDQQRLDRSQGRQQPQYPSWNPRGNPQQMNGWGPRNPQPMQHSWIPNLRYQTHEDRASFNPQQKPQPMVQQPYQKAPMVQNSGRGFQDMMAPRHRIQQDYGQFTQPAGQHRIQPDRQINDLPRMSAGGMGNFSNPYGGPLYSQFRDLYNTIQDPRQRRELGLDQVYHTL